VVSEKGRTPQGPFVDNLGTYDPRTEPITLRIDVAKTEEWIRKGAHPSPTVRDLLDKAKRLSS
jgi:small subunit ribosomal protein S16